MTKSITSTSSSFSYAFEIEGKSAVPAGLGSVESVLEKIRLENDPHRDVVVRIKLELIKRGGEPVRGRFVVLTTKVFLLPDVLRLVKGQHVFGKQNTDQDFAKFLEELESLGPITREEYQRNWNDVLENIHHLSYVLWY